MIVHKKHILLLCYIQGCMQKPVRCDRSNPIHKQTETCMLVCMYVRSFRAVTESSSDSESLLSVLKLSFVCLRFAKIKSALLVGL